MTWWMILLIILAIPVLLSQIRWKITVRYEGDVLTVCLALGPFPMKKLSESLSLALSDDIDARRQRRIMRENAAKRRGGKVSRATEILSLLAELLRALTHRKLRIKNLRVSVVWGCEGDPAAAAIAYGRANAVIGIIWPILDHNFKIVRSSFHVDVDYDATEPVIEAEALVTLSTAQLITLVFRYERRIQDKIKPRPAVRKVRQEM